MPSLNAILTTITCANYHKVNVYNHHHQYCKMGDSYIYLKVVVSDEKVPEDSCFVEIAQPNHVFNSLIGDILVVLMMMMFTRTDFPLCCVLCRVQIHLD